MKPHVHAELIKAWADGAEIQMKAYDGRWVDDEDPCWSCSDFEFRIKPQPKPDVIVYPETATSWEDGKKIQWFVKGQLKLIFDCETGKLKSAKVL